MSKMTNVETLNTIVATYNRAFDEHPYQQIEIHALFSKVDKNHQLTDEDLASPLDLIFGESFQGRALGALVKAADAIGSLAMDTISLINDLLNDASLDSNVDSVPNDLKDVLIRHLEDGLPGGTNIKFYRPIDIVLICAINHIDTGKGRLESIHRDVNFYLQSMLEYLDASEEQDKQVTAALIEEFEKRRSLEEEHDMKDSEQSDNDAPLANDSVKTIAHKLDHIEYLQMIIRKYREDKEKTVNRRDTYLSKNKRDYDPVTGMYRKKRDLKSLPPGLFVVIGGSESGKSYWISKLSSRLGIDVCFYSEPDHRSMGNTDDAVIALDFLYGHTKGHDVFLIDSLKDMLYSGGNLTKGGISMSALSRLSSIAARLMRDRIHVTVIVNPQQNINIDEIFETLKGSVTGVALIEYSRLVKCTYREWNDKSAIYDRKNGNIYGDETINDSKGERIDIGTIDTSDSQESAALHDDLVGNKSNMPNFDNIQYPEGESNE